MKDKKNINIRVGANIKRARENAGYTQDKFSELIGMGPKSLSAIERGTVGISLSALCRVCQTLAVSSDSLLFDSEVQPAADDLADQLARLTPAQYEIARGVIYKLLEAFALHEERE